MRIIGSVAEMQDVVRQLRNSGKRIGLVPTMGYLHPGHLSLMEAARRNADLVIATIFVNPIQFGPGEDFGRYPRDIERDKRLCESAGCDVLFLPLSDEMYPTGYRTYITVEGLTDVLEGKVRPGHFRGVTTIVAKLFHCTMPHVAVFGQKDAQQAVVLRKMVHDLNWDLTVIVAPTVREPDGVAMSSRNVYLSPEERIDARSLSESLRKAEEMVGSGQRDVTAIVAGMKKIIDSRPTTRIDYISVADPETLQELPVLVDGGTALISLAVRIGATRLIDNTMIMVQ